MTLTPTQLRDAMERLNHRGRNKFRAVRTAVDGITFDSKAEARRYAELKLLEQAGQIRDLHVHPRFPLFVGSEFVGTYVADFEYLVGNRVVVEDVKSKATRTPVYRLKAKLFRVTHGLEVREVGT